ncbi:hypothetical protein R1flu_026635 [Riccia fluitans]|uniref:Uncharacterized protein n=1 Tax=Riccia fluitans TaxID=41844 RepID=A0ABD1XGI1_9MARC
MTINVTLAGRAEKSHRARKKSGDQERGLTISADTPSNAKYEDRLANGVATARIYGGFSTRDPNEEFDPDHRALLSGYDPNADSNFRFAKLYFQAEIEEELRQERERAEQELREHRALTTQGTEEVRRANEETEKRRTDEAAKRLAEEEERRQAEEVAARRQAEEAAAKRRAEIARGKLPANQPSPQSRPLSPPSPPAYSPDSPPRPEETPSSPPLILPDSPHSIKRVLRLASAVLLNKVKEPSVFEGLVANREWEILRQAIHKHAGKPLPSEKDEVNEALRRSMQERGGRTEEEELEEARQRSLRDNYRKRGPEGPTPSPDGRPPDRQDGEGPSGANRQDQQSSPLRGGHASPPRVEEEDGERPSELLNAARRQLAEETQFRLTKRPRTGRSTVNVQDNSNLLEVMKWEFVGSMWHEARETERKMLLLEDLNLLQQLYEVQHIKTTELNSVADTTFLSIVKNGISCKS